VDDNNNVNDSNSNNNIEEKRDSNKIIEKVSHVINSQREIFFDLTATQQTSNMEVL